MTKHNLYYSIIIPSRSGSSRLPNKPTLQLTPYLKLAEATCFAAMATQAQQVVLIGDNKVVSSFDGTRLQQLFTDKQFTTIDCTTNSGFIKFEEELGYPVQNGTERTTAAVTILDLPDEHIVVNVQGDEPLFNPQVIDQLVQQFAQAQQSDNKVVMGSLCVPLDHEQLLNPNSVKVVLDQQQNALYFSRSPLPYTRESIDDLANFNYFKHVGVYCYKVGFLKKYCKLKITPLSYLESLEQLRVLEHGYKITMLPISTQKKIIGVDDPTSYQAVVDLLAQEEQNGDIYTNAALRANYLQFLTGFGKVATELAKAEVKEIK